MNDYVKKVKEMFNKSDYYDACGYDERSYTAAWQHCVAQVIEFGLGGKLSYSAHNVEKLEPWQIGPDGFASYHEGATLSEDDLERISKTKMSHEHDHLNEEVEDEG